MYSFLQFIEGVLPQSNSPPINYNTICEGRSQIWENIFYIRTKVIDPWVSHINNIEIFDSSVVKLLHIFVLRSLSLDLLWLKGISSGGSSSRSLKSFDEWWSGAIGLDWTGGEFSSSVLFTVYFCTFDSKWTTTTSACLLLLVVIQVRWWSLESIASSFIIYNVYCFSRETCRSLSVSHCLSYWFHKLQWVTHFRIRIGFQVIRVVSYWTSTKEQQPLFEHSILPLNIIKQ